MPNVDVITFGKLTLRQPMQTIATYPTKQVEALIGYLLLSSKRVHPRQTLIALLWPDVEIDKARHRFSVVLSRTRQLFARLNTPFETHFHSSREQIEVIDKRPFSLDRDRFVEKCHRAFRHSDSKQKESLLREALALYRGELLTGIDAEWCLVEREALARMRLRVLGELMYGQQQLKQHEEAILFGNLILKEDPLREEVHQALMISYAELDRFTEFSRQFDQLKAMLWEELQTPPLPDTIRLHNRLLADHLNGRIWPTFPSNNSPQMQKLHHAISQYTQASKQLLDLLREF